jgi:glycosyltransferase involved in cell wall biosynthesis
MLSVLIPTKGRPEKLEKCVKSIDVGCEILILATKEDDVSEFTRKDWRVSVYIAPQFSIIEAQNFLAEQAKYDLLPISDDIEFDAGSIQKALNVLYDENLGFMGNGVAAFHVRNMDCADYAYMLVGQKFYVDVLKEVLFAGGYKHFYADQELGNKAKKRSKFCYCMDATIFNYHPNAGYQQDETHKHLRSEKIAHDEQLYHDRLLHAAL